MRALAAGARPRHGRDAGADRGGAARRRGAVRARGARAAADAARLRRRRAARRAAVARPVAARARAAGRAPAGALDRAARARADRARHGRGPARLARLLRLAQRPALRRLHAAAPWPRTRRRARPGSAATPSALPRLATLFVDREVGLLRWAPVLALAVPRRLAAVALAARAARQARRRAPRRRARRVPRARGLRGAARGRGVRAAAPRRPAGATALAPALPCAVPLVAWGLRHAPRAGLALGALTLAGERLARATARVDARRTPTPRGARSPARSRREAGAVARGRAPALGLGALEWRRRRELRAPGRNASGDVAASCVHHDTDTTRTRRFLDALRRMQRRNDEEWIRRIESSAHQQHLLHGAPLQLPGARARRRTRRSRRARGPGSRRSPGPAGARRPRRAAPGPPGPRAATPRARAAAAPSPGRAPRSAGCGGGARTAAPRPPRTRGARPASRRAPRRPAAGRPRS